MKLDARLPCSFPNTSELVLNTKTASCRWQNRRDSFDRDCIKSCCKFLREGCDSLLAALILEKGKHAWKGKETNVEAICDAVCANIAHNNVCISSESHSRDRTLTKITIFCKATFDHFALLNNKHICRSIRAVHQQNQPTINCDSSCRLTC